MMKKLVSILLVFVSIGVFAQAPDTLAKAKKPHGMQFADVLAEHKGALILLGGKEYLGKITDLKGDSVDQISFIHAKDAVKMYGKKAAKGVFLINYKEQPFDNNDVLLPLPKNKRNPMLYILDDKVITEEQSDAVNPDDIDDYRILKELVSIAKYGKAGENGVVIITTKAAAKKQKDQQKAKN